MAVVRGEARAPSILDAFEASLADARAAIAGSDFMSAASGGGSEALYRGLLSAELWLARERSSHLAQAAWQVSSVGTAGTAGSDETALRLHFVRRTREVSARAALIEGALGGEPGPASPFTAALIAMHHHAACGDSRRLLAWELATGDAVASALDDAALSMRTRWSLPAPIAPLFDARPAGTALLLAPRLDDGVFRFAADVLVLHRSMHDALLSSS